MKFILSKKQVITTRLDKAAVKITHQTKLSSSIKNKSLFKNKIYINLFQIVLIVFRSDTSKNQR